MCLCVMAMPVVLNAASFGHHGGQARQTKAPTFTVPVSDELASGGAALMAQLALGSILGALEDLESRAEAQEFAQEGINNILAAMGQVTSASEAQDMLRTAKDYLTPAQKRQIRNARDGIERLIDRIPPVQRKAVYQGIAQALPDVLARHPEFKHFAPAVVEEFGLDWRNIAEHLTPQMRNDIRGR